MRAPRCRAGCAPARPLDSACGARADPPPAASGRDGVRVADVDLALFWRGCNDGVLDLGRLRRGRHRSGDLVVSCLDLFWARFGGSAAIATSGFSAGSRSGCSCSTLDTSRVSPASPRPSRPGCGVASACTCSGPGWPLRVACPVADIGIGATPQPVEKVEEKPEETREVSKVEQEQPDCCPLKIPRVAMAALPPEARPEEVKTADNQIPAPVTTAPQAPKVEDAVVAAAPEQGQINISNAKRHPDLEAAGGGSARSAKRYPEAAQARNQHGTVELAFSLDRRAASPPAALRKAQARARWTRRRSTWYGARNPSRRRHPRWSALKSI